MSPKKKVAKKKAVAKKKVAKKKVAKKKVAKRSKAKRKASAYPLTTQQYAELQQVARKWIRYKLSTLGQTWTDTDLDDYAGEALTRASEAHPQGPFDALLVHVAKHAANIATSDTRRVTRQARITVPAPLPKLSGDVDRQLLPAGNNVSCPSNTVARLGTIVSAGHTPSARREAPVRASEREGADSRGGRWRTPEGRSRSAGSLSGRSIGSMGEACQESVFCNTPSAQGDQGSLIAQTNFIRDPGRLVLGQLAKTATGVRIGCLAHSI